MWLVQIYCRFNFVCPIFQIKRYILYRMQCKYVEWIMKWMFAYGLERKVFWIGTIHAHCLRSEKSTTFIFTSFYLTSHSLCYNLSPLDRIQFCRVDATYARLAFGGLIVYMKCWRWREHSHVELCNKCDKIQGIVIYASYDTEER